jgi:hypothetical protein
LKTRQRQLQASIKIEEIENRLKDNKNKLKQLLLKHENRLLLTFLDNKRLIYDQFLKKKVIATILEKTDQPINFTISQLEVFNKVGKI